MFGFPKEMDLGPTTLHATIPDFNLIDSRDG